MLIVRFEGQSAKEGYQLLGITAANMQQPLFKIRPKVHMMAHIVKLGSIQEDSLGSFADVNNNHANKLHHRHLHVRLEFIHQQARGAEHFLNPLCYLAQLCARCFEQNS